MKWFNMAGIRSKGAFFLAVFAVLSGCGPMFTCDDEVKSRIPSPDKRLEAVYSIHACGATTEDASWVRVVRTGENHADVEPIATFQGALPSAPYWDRVRIPI